MIEDEEARRLAYKLVWATPTLEKAVKLLEDHAREYPDADAVREKAVKIYPDMFEAIIAVRGDATAHLFAQRRFEERRAALSQLGSGSKR